jgi:hypothetical protein
MTKSIPNALSLIMAKHEKTPVDVSRLLWSCFPGITTETASDYMRVWSVADIVSKRISAHDIGNHKLATGRNVNKKVINSLSNIDRAIEIKLLSCIPGISRNTAIELLNANPCINNCGVSIQNSVGTSLSKIIWRGPSNAATLVGTSKRKLGEVLAMRLVQCFEYKFGVVSTNNEHSLLDKPVLQLDM